LDIFLLDREAVSSASLYTLLGLSCPIKIVDVGANPIDGPTPYAALLKTGHATLVGFEPNPHALAALNARKSAYETYLPYAVADGERQTIRFCVLPGMTSLFEPNPAVLQLFPGFAEWGGVVQREEIQTVRLDDIRETAGLDMLKLDIQGGELMVFQNSPQRLDEALVIHTEAEFLPMYVGQPLFSEVELFLRSRGFLFHRFEPFVTRDFIPVVFGTDPYNGHSQAIWSDAIFLRDFTRLDLIDPSRLLKLAVILHDCYRSYDVALYVLREHDRRTGGDYGARYYAILLAALSGAQSQ
jgi:FkbM family methyltransferase